MADDPTILLTVFLRHDQSKNLEELQGRLNAADWWDRFPPAGCEIVSWNVVMGIGQIVTLRMPPESAGRGQRRARTLRVGAFATDFYPTYDFVPVRERLKREWNEKKNAQ